jgi:hypothetical protein
MSELSIDQLKNLGVAAVRDLTADDSDVSVDVQIALDSADEEACFFMIRIGERGHNAALPPALFQIRLIERLLERLQEAGDSRYPFINGLRFYPSTHGVSV